MIDPVQQQAIIIGVTIGSIVFLILVIIIVVCCCCRKAERSWFKRGIKSREKKFAKKKAEMTLEQEKRHEEMEKKHAAIREKYGLNKNNDLQPPSRDTVFAVENEQISLSLR